MGDQQRIFGQNKLLNHPDKIQNWLRREDRTIVTAEIDLTNRCNHQCPQCAGWAGKRTQAELTTAEAIDYILQLAMLDTRAIIFTGGGEPLLHAGLPEIIQQMPPEMSIGLITNGLLLTSDYHFLLDYCTWIRVSLDAGTPETYARVHGTGQENFEKVLYRLKALAEAKGQRKSPCTIGTGYLTGGHTVDFHEMERFLQVSALAGVDYAQFRPFHGDFTSIEHEFAVLKKRFRIATASIHKYKRFQDEVKRPYDRCYGLNFATVIGADANVYVCCHMRGIEKYALGNLRTHSLRHVWRRRSHMEIDFHDCPLFCRCDEFNRLTYEIAQPKQHINFL